MDKYVETPDGWIPAEDMIADLTRQLSEARDEIARLRKALREITERHLWSDDEPNVGTMMGIAKAALEASNG